MPALEPPDTASAASEKLPPNNALTVAPAGAGVSSSIAASEAVPVATGASFTAVTLSPMVTVPVLYRVTPPVPALVRSTLPPELTAPCELSIRWTVSEPGVPLKSAAGLNRTAVPAARIKALESETPVGMSVQVAPFSHCHLP